MFDEFVRLNHQEAKTSAQKLPSKDKLFKVVQGGPGVTTNAAGTSQACSSCGRNPIKLISYAKIGGQDAFATDKDGIGALGEESIRLWAADSDHQAIKKARRKNRRAPFLPLADQSYRLSTSNGEDQIRKAVNRSLRRPSENVQDVGTSQGHYHCVFTDCGLQLNADENASINIARRWLDRVLDCRRIYSEWDDMDVPSRRKWLEIQATKSQQAYGLPVL